MERLWDELSANRARTPALRADPELFALLLGLPEATARSCLEPDGRLRASGLLAVDEDGDIAVLRRLSGLLARRLPLKGDVRALLLGPPRRAELPWEAFRHLGEQAETAARVLAAAVAGFAALLWRTGLPRLHHPVFALPGTERATQDRFFLVVEGPVDDDGARRLRATLAQAGAMSVAEVGP